MSAPAMLRDRAAAWIGRVVIVETMGRPALSLRGRLEAVTPDGVAVALATGEALAPWHAVRVILLGETWAA
jgi:hypothetical protein